MKQKGSFVNTSGVGSFSNASGSSKNIGGFLNVSADPQEDPAVKAALKNLTALQDKYNNAKSQAEAFNQKALLYQKLAGEVHGKERQKYEPTITDSENKRNAYLAEAASLSKDISEADKKYNDAVKSAKDAYKAQVDAAAAKAKSDLAAQNAAKQAAIKNARANIIATTGKDPLLTTYIVIGSITAVAIIGSIAAYVYFKRKKIS